MSSGKPTRKQKSPFISGTKLFLSVCEFISILSIPLLYIFLRPRIVYSPGLDRVLDIPRGTLLIANHQSRLDPFFAVYYTGFRNVLRSLPLSFPVTSSYMRNVFLKVPMLCLGCFDVGETPQEKAASLLRMRNLLRMGETVFIFPEGKIMRSNDKLPDVFEKGINFLIGDKTPVVLVRLSGMRTWSFFNFTNRYQTQIRFSEMLPPGMSAEEKFRRIGEFYKDEEVI